MLTVVMYVFQVLARTVGRRFCYGPEGVVMRTGRSGPGKAYGRKCMLGNSLSIYAYSCCACISGTSATTVSINA